MFGLRELVYAALSCFGVHFIWLLAGALKRKAASGNGLKPSNGVLGVSFVATFFDTLGIGSFAPTTALFRQLKLIPDEVIPGTLNVGYVVPTILEAFIFIRIVAVGPTTLVTLIAASALGAWLGAGIVSHWSRRRIQIGMGMALIVAASIIVLSQPQVGLLPKGGEAFELHGWRLVVGIAGNFFLGALMTLGIGLYAPCMILVYLLGMHPTAAFPIMMGSCAFLMPTASVRFLKAGAYSPAAVVGMSLTGIPAVLIAAYIVKSLPLVWLRWLVVIVVVYTAIALLRAAAKPKGQP